MKKWKKRSILDINTKYWNPCHSLCDNRFVSCSVGSHHNDVVLATSCGYTDSFFITGHIFVYIFFTRRYKIFLHSHVYFSLVGSLVNLWIGKIFKFSQLSLSLASPLDLGRLTLIYSPFSISFADFGTRFLFVSLWGTKRGQSLSASFAWDSDWNEILFPVLMFGIWCKSVCLSSVLKQTINQQLEASGLQLLLDRGRLG